MPHPPPVSGDAQFGQQRAVIGRVRIVGEELRIVRDAAAEHPDPGAGEDGVDAARGIGGAERAALAMRRDRVGVLEALGEQVPGGAAGLLVAASLGTLTLIVLAWKSLQWAVAL